ncbi:MAG: VOC family protein [Candidatus Acidiferrales bacterium]
MGLRAGKIGIAFVLLAAVALAATGLDGQAPARPKVLGVAYVMFKTTNVEKAKAFYGGELGLASGDATNADPAAQAVFVVNRYQHAVLVKTAPGTAGSYLAEIGIATDDLLRMWKYLTAKGVSVTAIRPRLNGSHYFEMQDPENNKIAFVERPIGGNPGPAAMGAVSHKVIHTGLVVKDRAAMDRFYADILGCHVYWHGGMKEGETNWVDMQMPDGTDWIEYMLNVPANADQRTLGVMNHVALGVTDIHAAARQIEQNGGKLTEQPKIGRDGKWQLNMYDPDETRVELMEFTPTEKPCCATYTGPNPKP